MTAVIFGRGSRARLAEAFDHGTRVLAISTPGRARILRETLAEIQCHWELAALFTEVPQHVPQKTVDDAAALLEAHDASNVLAFGGGSPIGVAKALAVRRDLRKVYVPTTFSGSEMTNIWAVTGEGGKVTARDERVRADVVIYDADLVDSMPRELVFPSLFNALAHSIEALYADNVEETVFGRALESAGLLCAAIGSLTVHDDANARETALQGAQLAGQALDGARMGIHHKIAHVLGGTLGLPHSPTHTVVLPYALEYNRDFAQAAFEQLAGVLGADPVSAIADLERRSGVITALRDLGMRATDVPVVVDELSQREYPNPRPFDASALTELLHAAFSGDLVKGTWP